MSYFDKNKETFVTIDASPVGISEILSQKPKHGDPNNQQILAYASRLSRALSDTGKYTHKRKIVWAVEHFHLFLFGSEFTLVTDV